MRGRGTASVARLVALRITAVMAAFAMGTVIGMMMVLPARLVTPGLRAQGLGAGEMAVAGGAIARRAVFPTMTLIPRAVAEAVARAASLAAAALIAAAESRASVLSGTATVVGATTAAALLGRGDALARRRRRQ